MNQTYLFIVRNARKIVYAASIVWAVALYVYLSYTVPLQEAALAQLQRDFGLTALFMLFLLLTPGLVRVYFPRFRFNGLLIFSRKALGVSFFFFALAHAVLGFIYNLGGSLQGIFFLPQGKQTAVIFGAIALFIFSLLAITSIDWIEAKMGFRRWKFLHRFIYAAAVLVLFHVFLIGSNFTNPASGLPLFVLFLALAYVLLEVGATAKMLMQGKRSMARNILYYAGLALVVVAALYFCYLAVAPAFAVKAQLPKGEYLVAGHVVLIDNKTHYVTVRQEVVPGVMEAMLMIYPYNETQLINVSEGDNVAILVNQDPVTKNVGLINMTKS